LYITYVTGDITYSASHELHITGDGKLIFSRKISTRSQKPYDVRSLQ